MSDASIISVPRDFYCEHATSKTRVLAVLARPGCYDSLQAVLTCTDPDLAQECVALLRHALAGPTPHVKGETERLAGLLPQPVAASLHRAIDWASVGAWPVPGHAHRQPHPGDRGDDDEPHPALRDSLARTPSDAKLADLPGTVVRVIHMVEMHVHDPERLLTWSAATDWIPAPADELPPDDPKDVLGAAMWNVDNVADIPGVDLITSSSTAEILTPEHHDELADWSPTPIRADFGTGWRLRTSGRADTADKRDADESPDFASQFPIRDVIDEWQLTPRTADALHTALGQLADWAYDDIEEHGDQPVDPDAGSDWAFFNHLPRISWRQDSAWRRRVARAADDLYEDLEAGRWPLPRCNAEELLLHLAIDMAQDLVEDAVPILNEDLPHHEDDYDWGMCSEILFQDHDILLLNSGWADGVEDPDSDLNRQMRIGDLRPDNWFNPFDNVDPRRPGRGFRR